MIKLKSSRTSVVNAELGITAKVKFEVENLIVDGDNYRLNAHYYREETVEQNGQQITQKVILSQVNGVYSVTQVSALCIANNIPDIVPALLTALQAAALAEVKTKRKYQTIPSDWTISSEE